MARLILDTGVVVEAFEGRFDLNAIPPADDLALPSVVVAEYLLGILLTREAERAAEQRAFLDDVLALAPAVDYTVDVARDHAVLLAHVRKLGRPRGAHDLIVAAMARATDRVLLTTDHRARFDELPGVGVRLVGQRGET